MKELVMNARDIVIGNMWKALAAENEDNEEVNFVSSGAAVGEKKCKENFKKSSSEGNFLKPS